MSNSTAAEAGMGRVLMAGAAAMTPVAPPNECPMRQSEERSRREERRGRGRLVGPRMRFVQEEREEGREWRRVRRTQMERSSAMRCISQHA